MAHCGGDGQLLSDRFLQSLQRFYLYKKSSVSSAAWHAMPDMQQGGEMDVIAACVIGGVSMSGGRGTVLGALLGSLILATIAKALPLIPFFDQLWLNTIKGVIILVVVVVNIVLQRTADKNALKGREM